MNYKANSITSKPSANFNSYGVYKIPVINFYIEKTGLKIQYDERISGIKIF